MAFILYRFADDTRKKIEVTEEFAKKYAEIEHKDALIERKETRRHQSLDKSLERGFDISDPTVDIAEMAEQRELSDEIQIPQITFFIVCPYFMVTLQTL